MPETAWLEIETTIFIIEYLKQFNFELLFGKKISGSKLNPPSVCALKQAGEKNKHLYTEEYKDIFKGFTGAAATLNTGKPGKKFLFRFDIDALPVTESNGSEHIPNQEHFASRNEGCMHACGHDGHTAIGLCFAEWLFRNKEKLTGSFTLIFQPAEEGVCGAAAVLKKLDVSDYDYFFGLHIGLGMEDGVVGVDTKEFYGVKYIETEFFGKAAHAANKPEDGCNALLAAADSAILLHTMPQYGTGIARVNVGKLHSGTAGNIVPEYAKMVTGLRANKQDILNALEKRFKLICKNSAANFGVTCQFNCIGSCSCFENRDEEFANAINVILQHAGIKTRLNPELNASEDVTEFMKQVCSGGGKSIHLLIGTKLKDNHHNKDFDFDETCLITALNCLTAIVENVQVFDSV